jgi:hypothetical protein
MLKHMADDGDFNMLIDDDGDLLVVCSKCKKIWTGKLTLSDNTASANKAKKMMSAAFITRPSILMDIGIDKKVMATFDIK